MNSKGRSASGSISTYERTFAVVRSIIDGHFLAAILLDEKIFHFERLRTVLQQEESPAVIHDIAERRYSSSQGTVCLMFTSLHRTWHAAAPSPIDA